ncbi:uncharacterized protein DSM5745_00343 [Aspergillus mulundensis]|uniref:DUF7703 domain-containing protein n=1 Tax=Aspergillus mulundensis TaxID=1810919 RepID=A0A3D8T3I9_9EURO|nr:Uncharacterized protein DSM5745_00343 [Aspergillus mulundensis]RDW93021.1 Uncharacterized protein DSM5745_00343 [Aspergillus mulundensis]
MVEFNDVRTDLPMSMAMAAFTGVSWCLGVEVILSLFMVFKRRRGLYFWSCALGALGVILQPLFIILADFRVWTDPVPSIVMIYLTWFILVVPQSWVLYSRLHLLMSSARTLRGIKWVLVVTSIGFSVPTIVLGTVAQTRPRLNSHLTSVNITWDRVQLVVFFVQETALSIMYIFKTRKFLRGRSTLRWSIPEPNALHTIPSTSGLPIPTHAQHSHSHPHHTLSASQAMKNEEKAVLWQLIYANTLIIALDVTLLGIQSAGPRLFHLQGAFKPCVYGIKLKLEFVILNKLRDIATRPVGGAVGHWNVDADAAYGGSSGSSNSHDHPRGHGRGQRNSAGSAIGHLAPKAWRGSYRGEGSDEVQLVVRAEQVQ